MKTNRKAPYFSKLLVLAVFLCFGLSNGSSNYVVMDSFPLAPVFSATVVGFDLQTIGSRQYAVYYDTLRRMTIASRLLSEKTWQYKILPSTWGWDNHNYITLAVDDSGYIHVSGNMHSSPLVYFRSSRPNDISDFVSPGMVGSLENPATYPQFYKDNNGTLIFMYRSGNSGDGNSILNKYNLTTKTWSRLSEAPLFDGRGLMNAYPTAIVKGPDNYFHIAWMWRENCDANSNHDISYARSRDMLHWETAAGDSLTLPITSLTAGVVVDSTKTGNGLINMGFAVGFDARNRPIVGYHKYDASGKSQIYNTRFENGKWVIHKTSQWSQKWSFGGCGAIPSDIGTGPVQMLPDGRLVQSYWNIYSGSGSWFLNENTLGIVDTITLPTYPTALQNVQSTFPGMEVHWINSYTGNPQDTFFFGMRWETLPPNRDAPRDPPYPAPSPLVVYKLSLPNTGPKGWFRLTVKDSTTHLPLIKARVDQKKGQELLQRSYTDSQGIVFIPVDTGNISFFISSAGYGSLDNFILHIDGKDTATVDISLLPLAISALHIFPDSLILGLRDSVNLNCNAVYPNGSELPMKDPVVWTSLTPGLAQVSATGRIRTATTPGEALVVCASTALGFSDTLAVKIIEFNALSNLPLADCYVQDAEYANVNYGTNTGLIVWTTNASYDRRIYLKFNTTGLSGQKVMRATLKLNLLASNRVDPLDLTVFHVNTDWAETTLTWNNSPIWFTPLDTARVSSIAGWTTWDLASWIRSHRNDTVLNLCIVEPYNMSTNAHFASKEFSDTARRPRLEILYYDSTLGTTSVASSSTKEPFSFNMLGNPFNPECRIRVALPKASLLSLEVYDLAGRCIRKLANGALPSGVHGFIWMGNDQVGRHASSGVYLLKLVVDGKIYHRKAVLLK